MPGINSGGWSLPRSPTRKRGRRRRGRRPAGVALARASSSAGQSSWPSDEAVGRALLAAFPDRLCRRREPGSPRGVMVGGRGVRLAPSSGVTAAELFVAVDVDAGQAETLVRQASAVERSWLPADRLRTAVEVEFDDVDRPSRRLEASPIRRPGDRGEARDNLGRRGGDERSDRCRSAQPRSRAAGDGLAGRSISHAGAVPSRMDAGTRPAGVQRRRLGRNPVVAGPGTADAWTI